MDNRVNKDMRTSEIKTKTVNKLPKGRGLTKREQNAYFSKLERELDAERRLYIDLNYT
jgi:hypothetical protein